MPPQVWQKSAKSQTYCQHFQAVDVKVTFLFREAESQFAGSPPPNLSWRRLLRRPSKGFSKGPELQRRPYVTAVVKFRPGMKHETHSPCLLAACRGALHKWQKRRGICNNAEEICSYRGVLWRESRQIAAGNPWTSYCRRCGLLRSGESTEQHPLRWLVQRWKLRVL